MLFFLKQGYRVIAHDRRGHGRSTQTARATTWTRMRPTSPRWWRRSISTMSSMSAIPPAAARPTRYVAKHGRKRTAKLVLIGAVPPVVVKSASNPGGIPLEVFDGLRARSQPTVRIFYWDFPFPFYGYNRQGAAAERTVRLNWWRQAMMGGANAQYQCIKAFSETDFTDDLTSIDAPVLIMHGDDDQIVPIANSALLSAELVKHGNAQGLSRPAARHVHDARRSHQRRPARLHQVITAKRRAPRLGRARPLRRDMKKETTMTAPAKAIDRWGQRA